MISKSGKLANFIYFITNGLVLNSGTNRYFESGHIINAECVLDNTLVTEDYVADSVEVSVLKYPRDVFLQMINHFPDIEENVKQLVKDKRMANINATFMNKMINNMRLATRVHI